MIDRPDAGHASVSVAALRKSYGAIPAVSGVSLEVGAGEIFGLTGANGAGKTTVLECILGLRRPDSGSIRIGGLDPGTHTARVKRLVGAQLQAGALPDKITPRQALDLFGSFYARPFPAGELLARFELEAKANAPFATLSGGTRQRLFLALALVNRPAVLVLDEPTAGLDPQARRQLRSLIGEMRSEGRSVLLSTHDLEEAAGLCDRIAILDRGRIVAAGSPAELIDRAKMPARLTVRTAPPMKPALVNVLPDLVQAVPDEEGWILETRAPNRLLAELVRRTDEVGVRLLSVEMRQASLEDVFIEVTGCPCCGGESRGDLA